VNHQRVGCCTPKLGEVGVIDEAVGSHTNRLAGSRSTVRAEEVERWGTDIRPDGGPTTIPLARALLGGVSLSWVAAEGYRRIAICRSNVVP
jgi:hypothetical protein